MTQIRFHDSLTGIESITTYFTFTLLKANAITANLAFIEINIKLKTGQTRQRLRCDTMPPANPSTRTRGREMR